MATLPFSHNVTILLQLKLNFSAAVKLSLKGEPKTELLKIVQNQI